jgi:hypothetical protein
MKKYGIDFRPDKKFILSKITQERIMSYYLGLPIDLGTLFRSPLRNDANPTCGFAYSQSGYLLFRDFSGHFWGDCFDVVMYMRNCDFQTALDIISKDLDLIRTSVPDNHIPEASEKIRTRKKLSFRRSACWSEVDKEYWGSYHIRSSTLKKFHVSPMFLGFINDEVVYRYSKSDPGYNYWVRKDSEGRDRMKFYFPLRDRSRTRFMGNCDGTDIFGYDNLPPNGDVLIITKSLKDVMVLFELGISAIAVQAESFKTFPKKVMDELKTRFNNIITLFDFDATGVSLTNMFRKVFGTDFRFITNGRLRSVDYGTKDIADYIRRWGPEHTLSLIRINI